MSLNFCPSALESDSSRPSSSSPSSSSSSSSSVSSMAEERSASRSAILCPCSPSSSLPKANSSSSPWASTSASPFSSSPPKAATLALFSFPWDKSTADVASCPRSPGANATLSDALRFFASFAFNFSSDDREAPTVTVPSSSPSSA